ncbi:ClpP/crotonase-like domain-containing protein [Spinellus fusiger]|nr:ClpP/crotonase-like domain-containing protein [Spinellus fusiger]
MSHQFPFVLPSPEQPEMTVSREGPLFLLHLHCKDNRFTTSFCKSLLKVLEVIEEVSLKEDAPMALVTTGQANIYSNGLDFEHAVSHKPFMDQYLLVLKRMLTFCMPTVAAINGHAFAGGFMFALAHDYRVMRSDRGFVCMNEVDMPSPLSAGMSSLLRCKLSPTTYRDMVLQGHRFTAKECIEQKIVDKACPQDKVLEEAKALALHWSPKGKAGFVYKQLKDEMYRETIQLLSVPYHQLTPKL